MKWEILVQVIFYVLDYVIYNFLFCILVNWIHEGMRELC